SGRCPNCGKALRPQWQSCPFCSAPIEPAATQTIGQAARVASLEVTVGTTLTERIFKPQRPIVLIMFALAIIIFGGAGGAFAWSRANNAGVIVPVASVTATATPTVSPTNKPTNTPTSTPTSTPTAELTFTPTPTPTETPTLTETPLPPTATTAPTPKPTRKPTPKP